MNRSGFGRVVAIWLAIQAPLHTALPSQAWRSGMQAGALDEELGEEARWLRVLKSCHTPEVVFQIDLLRLQTDCDWALNACNELHQFVVTSLNRGAVGICQAINSKPFDVEAGRDGAICDCPLHVR